MKNNLISICYRKPTAEQNQDQQNRILIKPIYNHTGFQYPDSDLSYIKTKEKMNSSSEQIEQLNKYNVEKKKSQRKSQIVHQKIDKKLNHSIFNMDNIVYILLFCILYLVALFLAPNQFYHPKN